jgi:CRISPR/Cas system-associated exonuclease Cas4 (RecB family)
MISLKRNSNLELIAAQGKRTKAESIYTPNQKEDFKISRSKFDNFLLCPRCFYLDRVKGLMEPGMPGWSLNSATDFLLKKEFDECREKGEPHRLFKDYGLDDLIPFNHPDIDDWRDSLRKGLVHRYKDTNIILSGGVDDIWYNKKTEELVVVDYKSQASNEEVETDSYLNNAYHQGYKVQMDFYNYLLNCMGYKTSPISYFLVVNANKNEDGFFGNMKFSETIIPYKHDTSWVSGKVQEMINTMNSFTVPESNQSCENCAYSRARSFFDLSN